MQAATAGVQQGVRPVGRRPVRPVRLMWLALAFWMAALSALFTPWASAQDLKHVPALSARVIDQTGTLEPDRVAALEARLAAFETEAGPQIVVLMVASTQPEDIAAYAQRVGETWKIGRKDVGDGLLIVVAKDDRRVNIQTAKALEGAVPDLAARQIIDRAMRPAFRANDYAGGLDAAVEQLIARIRGESLPAPDPKPQGGGAFDSGAQLGELLMFLFVAVPVIGGVMTGVFGRKLGALVTSSAAGGIAWWLTASILLGVGAAVAGLVMVGLFGIGSSARSISRGRSKSHRGGPPIIFGSGGDHGGWGGGFGGGGFGGGGGGGGFSSGGGGDFGGGGASGDW